MARSQMAEKFFNAWAKDGSSAQSAGTVPGTIPDEPEGWQLNQIPYLDTTISLMKELGFEISHKKTRRVTPEMVREADLVVNMAEKETVPDFLASATNTILWSVPNPDRDIASLTQVKNQLLVLVGGLVKKVASDISGPGPS